MKNDPPLAPLNELLKKKKIMTFFPIETFPKSPEEIVPVSFVMIRRSVGRRVEDLHQARPGALITGRQQ